MSKVIISHPHLQHAHYKLVGVRFDKEETTTAPVCSSLPVAPPTVPPTSTGGKFPRVKSLPNTGNLNANSLPSGTLPPAAEAEKASLHSADSSKKHVHGHGSHCHHGPRVTFAPSEHITGKIEIDVSQQTPPGSGSHLPHLPHINLPHINFHLPGHSSTPGSAPATGNRRKGRSISESGGDTTGPKHDLEKRSSLTSSSSSSDEGNANNLTITSTVSQPVVGSGHKEPGWKEITLKLEGYGKTQWRVAGENGGRAHMRETLCNVVQTIRIAPDLPPGRHTFPFEFELPDDLPPCFEGKHGFIRYRLRVKPGHGAGNLKLPFNVVYAERVDDDALLKPVEDTRQRNIHFWCVSRGTRSVHAKLDRTVYHYQGDVAYINARFSNECRSSAKPTVKLIQQQTFYGRGLISKTFKKSIQAWLLTPSADLSPLQPDEERLWVNVECTLPVVTPSFHSSIIDVDYYIEIELADTKASLPSKAAAKMLMSHSATHNAVASIWILVADGAFQKKPTGDRPPPISLVTNHSKGSLISDTSSDISVPITPISPSAPVTPLTVNTSSNKEQASVVVSTKPSSVEVITGPKTAPNEGSPIMMKKMPYIREDSKEG